MTTGRINQVAALIEHSLRPTRRRGIESIQALPIEKALRAVRHMGQTEVHPIAELCSCHEASLNVSPALNQRLGSKRR
jgi:hypothetical protein